MAKKKKEKISNLFLKITFVIGMLISLFLLYEHFDESASKFCTFGSNFDCGVVNKSPYANLDGISYLFTIDMGLPLPIINIANINPFFDLITANAFLGFLTLVFMVLLLLSFEKKKELLFIKKDWVYPLLKGLAIFGVVYGGYLFLVQKLILNTYCIFCLGLDVTLITILVLVWRLNKK